MRFRIALGSAQYILPGGDVSRRHLVRTLPNLFEELVHDSLFVAQQVIPAPEDESVVFLAQAAIALSRVFQSARVNLQLAWTRLRN